MDGYKREMPKRDIKHISETASGKLFKQFIPDNWLVRDLSERDYGIDFYLEMVTLDNQLTGKLALIQLKSRQSISWTMKHNYAISDIKISSTNYWNEISLPVFIILADLNKQEIYFENIKSFIRQNHDQFNLQSGFTYHLQKKNQITIESGITPFLDDYERELLRGQFEIALFTFLSSLQPYADFIRGHSDLDYHMEVEAEEAIYIEAILNNYHTLAHYLNIQHNLPTISEMKANSKRLFPNNYSALLNHDLNIISEDLEKTTLLLFDGCKKLVNQEDEYWNYVNSELVDFIEQFDIEYLFR